LIQNEIGATHAGAFDISAACSGFIFALNMASQAIRRGTVHTALVIGTETLSRIINWKDRNTCILFGDGAGALVLQASELPGGVYEGVMHADGSGGDLLKLPAGGSRLPASPETVAAGLHFVQMDGREVFRFATRVMARVVRETLEKNGWDIEQVAWIVPHQANYRIIESAARSLKLPIERFIINLERYGNTSTASIPLAIVEAAESGRIEPGQRLVLVGFGAGLTWGAIGLQWVGAPDQRRYFTLRPYMWWARVHAWYQRLVRFIEGLLWGRWLR
jgi:3-oxoacyl-[acyl-carrier-protein] synthase-3